MFGKISCWFFLTNNNETTKLYNICFSFIAHRIHKYNMYCRIEETSQSSRISIKKNTLSYYSVLSLLHQMKEKDFFQNFALMLYVCIYTSNYYCVIYTPTRRGDSHSVVYQGYPTWTQTLIDGSEILLYLWIR